MTQAIPLPFDDEGLEKEARQFVAPQWKLVWWKFRKHKVALVVGVIVILFYLVAIMPPIALGVVAASRSQWRWSAAPQP